MNYLERLSSGDVKTICELIGPRELKQNFKKNVKWFNYVKPGFRPDRVSNEQAIEITVDNVFRPFVSDFLNEKIKILMDKIADEKET